MIKPKPTMSIRGCPSDVVAARAVRLTMRIDPAGTPVGRGLGHRLVERGQARPVAQQVAHGDLRRDPGIRHAEPGKVGDHRVIPGEFAILHEDLQCRGGEGLAVGSDGEKGFLVDEVGLAGFFHAISFGHDHFAILNDNDRYARYVEAGKYLGDISIESGGHFRLGPQLSAHREHGQEEKDEQDEVTFIHFVAWASI